jgi:hypothetical protein
LLWLALVVYFHSPVREAVSAALDPSNYSSYAYFTAHGFQYGAEVVPMAGPYGFVLYGWVYSGDLFWIRTACELLLNAALATLSLWFFLQHRRSWLGWVWLAAHVAFTPFHEDLLLEWTLLLAGLYLVQTPPRAGGQTTVWLAAALLAFLSLIKGTQLLLSIATLGVVLAGHASLRRWTHVARLAGVYGGALLFWWLLARQHPLHLPAYLANMLELAQGYNVAMGLEETAPVFHRGVAVSVALLVALGWAGWCRRKDYLAVAGLLLVAGHAFAQWKHGFVRADGHAFIYFHFALVAAISIQLIAWPWAEKRSGRAALVTGFCLLLAVLGASCLRPRESMLPDFPRVLPRLRERFTTNFAQLRALPDVRAAFDRQLAGRRELYAMPLTRRAVGASRVDQFGFEHARLTLNGLNYRPRPMGGGPFNVYTPALMQLNRDFLRDPARRPGFFVTRLETIDERLLAQDDGLAFVDLLSLYEPVLMEQDHLLLRARPGAVAPQPRLVSRAIFQIGDTVPVPAVKPGELLLARFDVQPSLAGRLRNFLYKAPRLRLALHGPGISEPNSYRLIPVMVASPFLLGPLVENTRDLIEFYGGQANRWPQTFRISTADRTWFNRTIAVEFLAITRPPIPAGPDLAALLKFTDSAIETVFTTLAGTTAPVQLRTQLAHAPAQFTWTLDGHERALTFGYGLVPAAYDQTDGVEFTVTLLHPDQPAEILFRRLLEPHSQPSDRGHHRVRLDLPALPPGTRLEITTGPGPHGNNAFDWAYLSELDFLDADLPAAPPAPAGR